MIDAQIIYDGDILSSVEIKKGLQVRPLWAKLERLKPDEMISWVDRFDSLCAVSSEWALSMALEEAYQLEVTLRDQYVRTILNELNRLIYYTTYLGNMMLALSHRGYQNQVMALREQVFSIQEELTGGRILVHALSLGGCRRGLALGDIQKVRQFLNDWKKRWESWLPKAIDDPILVSRLEGLMPISADIINKFSWWGIVGKASGVNYDSRRHRPHGAYPYLHFNLISKQAGDALARFQVAVEEVNLSVFLIDQALSKIPNEGGKKPSPGDLFPGYYYGYSESAKGPVVSAVEISDQKFVTAVRLFSVNSRIWPVVDRLFSGIRAEEFDLALASLAIDAEDGEA